ncbi:MAG: type II secretion system F family protein [Candidatus Gastranaerophilales bacterium]|nr:type II secretion system F family protein [Candidatus Gastranaerophilales bacterium]
MANFFFKVKNADNKIEQGSINAVSLTDAAVKLEQRGFIVLEIKEESSSSHIYSSNYSDMSFSKKMVLSIREKKEFFNSFYFLYKSGYSIMQVFDSMYNSSKNLKIKSLCSKILKGINQGRSLKESMKNCSNALGIAYTMLVVAGEESGKLENILSEIIKNITMQEKVKNDIISKMTYPAAMFFLALFVGLLFKTFIIEIFNSRAAGSDACIMSIAISACLKIGFVFLIIGGIIFTLYKNKNLLAKIASTLFAFGPIANLIKNYNFSNFFSVLSLSYAAGLTGAESLYLSNTVVKLPNVAHKLKKAADRVQQGCELTTALGATSLFTEYAISQVSAGEKAGELEKMLKAVAFDYESRLRVALDVMLKLLEPLMIGFVGLIVLYVAVSGYKAYYNYLFSLM